MKSIYAYALCVLCIAVPCVLVAMGSLISCFAAMIIAILTYAISKEHPQIWRNFYRSVIGRFTKTISE